MTVTVEINGRTHTIDDSEPVGAGNEAIVHPMPDGRVIKLYSKPIKIGTPRGNDTLSKLRIMINRPPVTVDGNGNKVLAWPQEVALQPASLHGVMLAGFTMPRVGGDEYRSIFDYWNPKRRNSISGLKGNREAIDRLLEGIIANMINNVQGIHEQGYIIGDINEKNILVGPNALINIIDCDSFQVRGYKGIFYKCPVGRPEYTSPRLHSELKQICTDTRCSHQPGQKRSYSCLIRTKEDDAFALAVMLYQLLMEGWHPYNGAPGSNVQEKILSVRPLCDTDPSQMPVPARERWHKLNDTWQNYFQDTLTGTRSWTENEIPGTDRIFKTKGFRPQVIIETEESANNPSVPATNTESTPSKKVLPDPDRRAAQTESEIRFQERRQKRAREAREARELGELGELRQRARKELQREREELEAREPRQREREEWTLMGGQQREREEREARQRAREELYAREPRELREELYARELRELRETQQREREAREPRLREKYAGKPREAQQREREFYVLQEDLEERELLEGQQRAREGRQSPRAAWEAAQRTNTSSTPTNVCPNCLNPFMQGEVYCQTANCITVLQTKTSPCIGCGKPIPSTAAFCRHCGLKQ